MQILGDIFESLVGAVYLDSGYDLNVVWDVFYRIMWQEIDLFSKNVPKNVVRLLYETPCARPKFRYYMLNFAQCTNLLISRVSASL